jgi:hypothetical protein
LMKKLDLHSGPALTAYAFENGLAVTSARLNSAEFTQESTGSHARRSSYR